MTHEDIEAAVKIAVEKYKKDIMENRYRVNIGIILGYIRTLPKMLWADGLKLKLEAEQQIIVLLGPKTDEDRLPPKPVPKQKDAPSTSKKSAASSSKSSASEIDDTSPQEKILMILRKLPFHKPGNNYITEGYPCSDLSMKLLRKHLRETNGQVRRY